MAGFHWGDLSPPTYRGAVPISRATYNGFFGAHLAWEFATIGVIWLLRLSEQSRSRGYRVYRLKMFAFQGVQLRVFHSPPVKLCDLTPWFFCFFVSDVQMFYFLHIFTYFHQLFTIPWRNRSSWSNSMSIFCQTLDWFNHHLALNISSLFLRQVLRFCNSDFQDDLEIVRQAPPKIIGTPFCAKWLKRTHDTWW